MPTAYGAKSGTNTSKVSVTPASPGSTTTRWISGGNSRRPRSGAFLPDPALRSDLCLRLVERQNAFERLSAGIDGPECNRHPVGGSAESAIYAAVQDGAHATPDLHEFHSLPGAVLHASETVG